MDTIKVQRERLEALAEALEANCNHSSGCPFDLVDGPCPLSADCGEVTAQDWIDFLAPYEED